MPAIQELPRPSGPFEHAEALRLPTMLLPGTRFMLFALSAIVAGAVLAFVV